MQYSTQPPGLCSKCQQVPTTATLRTRIDIAEVYSTLRSECGPSAVRSKEMDQLLLAAEKELSDRKAGILYLQTQQAQLEAQIRAIRCLGSPVRRLPNELMSRIFDYACETNFLQEFPWCGRLPDDIASPDDGLPTIMSAPALTYLPAMAISAVCARWRAIAVSLPSLWSRMSLVFSFNCAKSPNAAMALNGFISAIELHLLRSVDHTLDLTVDVRGVSSGNDLPPFDLLKRHCSRWRSFRFLGLYICSDLSTPPFPPFELPVLEELELLVARAEDLKNFEKASMVRSLTTLLLTGSELPLSRECLTSLDINNDVELALDQFPNLRVLRLRKGMSLTVAPKQSNTIISLSLVLSKYARHFDLDSLTIPSLVELKLETPKNEELGPRLIKPLLGFLKRSAPSSLTSFTVQNVTMTDPGLVAVLKLMPSLTNLTIDDSGVDYPHCLITEHLIRMLHNHTPDALHSDGNTGATLVPKLRCLKMHSGGTSFDDMGFISMVSSRWLPDAQLATGTGTSCLRTVVMSFETRAVDEETYRPLHLLDKEGMMATVISQGRTLMF